MVLDYTLDQFINNNIFLGYSKKDIVSSSYCSTSGKRQNTLIINIMYSIYSFKIIYHFLSNFWNNFGSLWLTYFNKIKVKLYFKQYKKWWKCRLTIWEQEWKSGVLSNYKHLLVCPEINFKHTIYPNAVFFLSMDEHSTIWKEPLFAKITSILVTDTLTGQKYSSYGIPGNEKAFISKISYIKLLQNFIIRIFILRQLLFYTKVF